MDNFYEKQKFNTWWVKLIFLIPLVIIFWGIINGKTLEDKGTHLLIVSVILGFIAVLFYFTKLETRIDRSGITIRFFPFQRTYYYVRWDEIERASIRKYKPILEYGGWGLRYSLSNGKAFNVSGNMGLQLVLKSGKKFLIGTQKAEELQQYLAQLSQEKAIPSGVHTEQEKQI